MRDSDPLYQKLIAKPRGLEERMQDALDQHATKGLKPWAFALDRVDWERMPSFMNMGGLFRGVTIGRRPPHQVQSRLYAEDRETFTVVPRR